MAKSKKKSAVVANKISKTGKTIKTEFGSFLSDKPIWTWWIAYTLAIGVLCLVLIAALTLLTNKWWVTVLLIIVIGFIWGTLNFNKHTKQEEQKKILKK